MPSIAPSATVGQIVSDNPAAARVFESHGIDYCCGGSVSLADACARRRLGLEQVIREINAAAAAPQDEPDWAQASMTHLADHIERRHHDFLRAELPRLAGLTRKVAAVHGDAHPELREVAEVFASLAAEMFDHMKKEELVLFPVLRSMERGVAPPMGLARPIACMVREHEDAGAALAKLRGLTGNYAPPPGACATYTAMLEGLRRLEEDLHLHVHKENNILFPKARRAGAVEP
jgi:regulator of cell morphogenesis and NO signaling